jgi:hypothetical protein
LSDRLSESSAHPQGDLRQRFAGSVYSGAMPKQDLSPHWRKSGKGRLQLLSSRVFLHVFHSGFTAPKFQGKPLFQNLRRNAQKSCPFSGRFGIRV